MRSMRYPDGHVLLRSLDRDYPTVARGSGMYLFDTQGKRYLDAAGGALVNSVGHGNAQIVARIAQQLGQVAYVNGMQFTSAPTEALAEKLCARAPPGLDRAFFLSSGSEAIEAALKFVRQLWVERGEPQREVFVARTPGYHGNTLYALSASARPHYKKFFAPLLSEVELVAAPYEYRSQVGDYEKDGGAFYAEQFAATIRKIGADRVAGFIAEPIIGSSAGGSPPPPNYFEKITAICRAHGIPLIADEILCGSGRTGSFYASSHYDLQPDVLVLGKGLNSGYAPLSAVLVRGRDVETLRRGSGNFMHAQTYLQAPSMTACGLAVVDFIDEHALVERARTRGEALLAELRRLLMPLPHVGWVSGRGFLAGIELVADKGTKAPFPRAQKCAEKFVAHAFAKGLIVWPNVGQADGLNGDLFMIGPPLNASDEDLEALANALADALSTFTFKPQGLA